MQDRLVPMHEHGLGIGNGEQFAGPSLGLVDWIGRSSREKLGVVGIGILRSTPCCWVVGDLVQLDRDLVAGLDSWDVRELLRHVLR